MNLGCYLDDYNAEASSQLHFHCGKEATLVEFGDGQTSQSRVTSRLSADLIFVVAWHSERHHQLFTAKVIQMVELIQ